MDFELPLAEYLKKAQTIPFRSLYGKVSEVVGLIVKVEGLDVFVGEICEIAIRNSPKKDNGRSRWVCQKNGVAYALG